MDQGGNLVPPPVLPPVCDGDFDRDVPREPVLYRVWVPGHDSTDSGFFAEGYLIPDAFPTLADALSFVERNPYMGEGVRVVQRVCSQAELDAISER